MNILLKCASNVPLSVAQESSTSSPLTIISKSRQQVDFSVKRDYSTGVEAEFEK